MNTGVGSWSLSPGDLSHSGIEPGSPALQADSVHPASNSQMWRILRCGPGYLIPKHVHESAKWKCWFSMINLLFPACSQLLHCWLLKPNSPKLSFDSSFFLTPPSIPLAMISVPLPNRSRLCPLTPITPCLPLLSRLQKPPVFILPAVVTLMMDAFLFSFFWLEEEGRNCLLSKLYLVLRSHHLFWKNSYEVPIVCKHWNKECLGRSKYKEAGALRDKERPTITAEYFTKSDKVHKVPHIH